MTKIETEREIRRGEETGRERGIVRETERERIEEKWTITETKESKLKVLIDL